MEHKTQQHITGEDNSGLVFGVSGKGETIYVLPEDIPSDAIIIDPIKEYEKICKWFGENIGNRNDSV